MKVKFRDVCNSLQGLRKFLMGNRQPHDLHNRFEPKLASRSVPAPNIPRTSVNKYSEMYYCTRSAKDSVHPPVVAPIALGIKQSKQLSASNQPSAEPSEVELVFPSIPTPGPTYWWDGHSYFEKVADPPPKKSACPPKPNTCPPPCPPCPPWCPPDPCSKK